MKITTLLMKMMKNKDKYGITEIDRILTYLKSKKGFYYWYERKKVNELIKDLKQVDISKLNDSIVIKMIRSNEVWKVIAKALTSKKSTI